jgi:hypothetical protein
VAATTNGGIDVDPTWIPHYRPMWLQQHMVELMWIQHGCNVGDPCGCYNKWLNQFGYNMDAMMHAQWVNKLDFEWTKILYNLSLFEYNCIN